MFQIKLLSTSARLSHMIVLDQLLKLWMGKFYRVQVFFEKLKFWSKFRKFRKISKKLQFHQERRSCSTSYSSGNQVDSSPLVAIALKSNDS